MIKLLAVLFPVAGASVAGIRPIRPWILNVLLVVASVDLALTGYFALASPASEVVVFGAGYFVADATSRLFLLVVNLVFLGIATYLWTRVRDTPDLREGIERLAGFALIFIAAANLAILSNHVIAMWVLVEATTLAAVPLIQFRLTPARLRASWRYFLFSSVGLALSLLGIACLARGMEGHEVSLFLGGLAEAAHQPPETWRRVGLALLLLGYGTKLGLAPMHTWLPETYHAAPPSVTALLGAVQFNVALTALLRILQAYGDTDRALIGPILLTLGLATMALSAFGIIATRNYVKLIAFASLNHGGVIAVGLGIGAGAAYGVVLYAVSNAFIKAILFLTAGKIEAHYQTEDVREVSGLLKDMPYSGMFFMVGTFALLGFPPFGSFLGELIIMSGLIGAGHFVVFAAFCAILTVTFIATGRSVFPMIWGEPKKKVNWASQNMAMVLPKLVFLCFLLAMGVYLPAPVNALFRQVAVTLGPMNRATFLAPADSLGLPAKAFFDAVRTQLVGGARPMAFYGQPSGDPNALTLTMLLEAGGRLSVLRTEVARSQGFHALTRGHPALHVFEREIHEQHGVKPHDHPWLKPVRFPSPAPGAMAAYPFYSLEGKEVHEVAVGPIHAGVIEPGHFRFMCLGETVHHLEIHLGYQHRGVEALLLRPDPRALSPLVETIAGDASVAHAWASADAVEALAGVTASPELEASRGLGLELERIAMHLAGLSGLANDVAFLQGAATYGRLRTTAINTTMLVCGSRFGRGWVRPGAVRHAVHGEVARAIRAALTLLEEDVRLINERMLDSASVRHRLAGVGTVTREQALEIGMVGAAARASGVSLDLRSSLPGSLYRRLPVSPVVEAGGDCMARALVRMREIDQSIRWARAALDAHPELGRSATALGPLAPDTLAIGVRESWRGEVVHALETDGQGRLRHYKVQDPSLRNWHGLALAVRGNDISDFPVCNKSFDLSYCGNDL